MRLRPTVMRLRPTLLRSLALALLVSAGGAQALADDSCAGFKWDVSKERALFGGAAQSMPAGKDGKSAPGVAPNRLYQLQLLPRSEVVFSVPPGKATATEGTYAGVVALNIPTSGSYRLAVDLPIWIDVAANGKLVPATDYEGQHNCSAPRKIVEFNLDGKQQLQLQLSGADQAAVRLTITRVLTG
jgi:hypothetical protein